MVKREIPIFSEVTAQIVGRGKTDPWAGRAISTVRGEEGARMVREAIARLKEKKFKLKILVPVKANFDGRGVTIVDLRPGEVHKVRLSQARDFVKAGWAEPIDELPPLDDRPDKKAIETGKEKLKAFSIGHGAKIKIRMIQTQDSSPDGINIIRFHEGQIYEAPESLAKNFIGSNWAEKITEEK